jgi:Cu(I)/Ag(I) efflux system membrane protein CusA/SilA
MRFLIYQKIRLLFSGGWKPTGIEDQVTLPGFNLQGVPKVKIFFFHVWMSFIYIIFLKIDPYWAENPSTGLNYAQRLLPQNVVPTLGPDGTV